MELVVVGSGTAAPDPERAGSAYYIGTGDCRLLLDCGPGALHHLARFGLPWSALTHIAITHFHADHTGDLPGLLFALRYALPAPRTEPLALLGPPGTAAFLDRLAAAFGAFILDPGFPLAVHELAPGAATRELGPGTRITAHPTPHTAASVAYRVHGPEGDIGYTGDTGFDPRLADFFRRVDLLVAECSVPDDAPVDTHLSPARLATLAALAQPRELLITHVYPPLEALDPLARVRAAGWAGPLRRAHDGLRIALPGP